MASAPFNTVAVDLRPALSGFASSATPHSRSVHRQTRCSCNDITLARPAAVSFLNSPSLQICSPTCVDLNDEAPVPGLFPVSRQGGFFR